MKQLASWACVLILSACTPTMESGMIITTLEAFEENVVGRSMEGEGWINLVVQSDGTLAGVNENDSRVTGPWKFRDGFFCREPIIGGVSRGWDCQIVTVTEDKAFFARERGKGERVRYRFKARSSPANRPQKYKWQGGCG